MVRRDVSPGLRVVADPVRRIGPAGRSPTLRARLPVAAGDVGLEVSVDGRLRWAPSDTVARVPLPRPESLEGDAVPFVAFRDFGIHVGALGGERDIRRRKLSGASRTAGEGSHENAQETPSRAVAHGPLDAAHPPIIPNICVHASEARPVAQIVQCQSPREPQEVQCQSRGKDAQRRQNAPLRSPQIAAFPGGCVGTSCARRGGMTSPSPTSHAPAVGLRAGVETPTEPPAPPAPPPAVPPEMPPIQEPNQPDPIREPGRPGPPASDPNPPAPPQKDPPREPVEPGETPPTIDDPPANPGVPGEPPARIEDPAVS